MKCAILERLVACNPADPVASILNPSSIMVQLNAFSQVLTLLTASVFKVFFLDLGWEWLLATSDKLYSTSHVRSYQKPAN